jgi:hypothetical protein
MKKQIKKIGILSLAKVYGLSFAALGLIIGILVALASAVIGTVASSFGGLSPFMGAGIGFLGLIVFPLLYGGFGFLMGALSAVIYNLIAQWVGGIEVEVKDIDSIS